MKDKQKKGKKEKKQAKMVKLKFEMKKRVGVGFSKIQNQ